MSRRRSFVSSTDHDQSDDEEDAIPAFPVQANGQVLPCERVRVEGTERAQPWPSLQRRDDERIRAAAPAAETRRDRMISLIKLHSG
jgi:hypothetical protein